MKIITSFLYLLIIPNVVFAQWKWQNPIPTSNHLFTVTFLNDSVVYCGGDGGFMMKSTNAGTTWDIINTNCIHYLDDIFLIDENNIVAVGWGGAIIKSSDGGETWQKSQGTGTYLKDVFFLDSLTGWISGGSFGVLLRTTDGGNSWVQIFSSTPNHPTQLFSVNFFDLNNGLVIDYYDLYASSDSGFSWNAKSTGFSGFRNMIFTSHDTGFIVGDFGLIIKTSDGGNTWIQQYSGTNERIEGITFKDENNGIAIGLNGFILITSDGGNTWTNSSTLINSIENLYAIGINSEGTALAVGLKGELIKSTDCGLSWERIRKGSTNNLNAITMLNEDIGWVVGDFGTILKTTNGGAVWESDSLTSVKLNDVKFFSENLGWICGDSGTILKTTNGGQSWIQIQLGNSSINSIFFIDQNIGWAACKNGSIYKTTDSGTNWELEVTNTTSPLLSLFFLSEYKGWCTSLYNPRIIKTNDGGLNWNPSGNIGTPVYSIYFLDSLQGWTVGFIGTTYQDIGVIWRTTNGGVNWYRSEFPWSYRFYDLHFLDSFRGWIFGRNLNTAGRREGIIAHTIDGGQSLSFERSSTGNPLLAASVVSESKIWVVGENGTILQNNDASIPVQFITFTGSAINDQVLLSWSTATETNNFGFEIERKLSQELAPWRTIGFVKGSGTSTELIDYSFSDKPLASGTYVYRLKQVDLDGSFSYSNEVIVTFNDFIFSLFQNYPNPFNPTTIIKFILPEKSFVTLKVYDLLGSEIDVLIKGELSAGIQSIEFNGKNLASGIYFYRLTTDKKSDIRKMILIK